MDTLALLCNLYGDGPQTLRRLREAGCGTLAALDALESERLATLLRTSVRSATRFQAEGRLLRERSEPTAAPARAATETAGAAVKQRSDPLVQDVLSAWRERDSSTATAVGPSQSKPSPAAALPAPVRGGDLGTLKGADVECIARLHEAGIRTLQDLRDADVLDLAGRGVGGYTRLLHLQFLARRSSVPAAEPDLLVPVRPPDRRGARAEVQTARAPEVRFSPRSEPSDAPQAPLEPELRRFASGEGGASVTGASEDAGSSGPFA